ncbi:hypothetical protein O0235_09175 [Tepidiforma flava]|uniref:EAL domain-containing protein n=1 Tax=Tepidiforma flava TaxID=3004094 RepID=A0ABY7M3L1_9CHLR|nr:hypothetical protein [Tepidiforma flava]WBL34965.1 hypothetical protein O0235_09175 [Tepidiforma flava]
MSVNVSAAEFQQPDLTGQHPERVLEAAGLDPAALQLELTESVLMRDVPAALEVLQELTQARRAARSLVTTSAPGTRR